MQHNSKPYVGLAVFFALLITAFTACKKGDVGPAGPPGSANVIYSAWMKTNPWTPSTTSTGSGKATYYFDITAPKVTQSIIDSGTVLLYAKFIGDPDGAGIAKLLPSTYYNLGAATTQYNFQHGLFLNKIRVICDVVPAGTPSTSNDVRYIIIPGGVPASGRMDMSYEAVCARYNIPQ